MTRLTIVAAAAAAAAPPAAQQKIRIKLSAYQVDLLLESVEMIRNAAAETGQGCLVCSFPAHTWHAAAGGMWHARYAALLTTDRANRSDAALDCSRIVHAILVPTIDQSAAAAVFLRRLKIMHVHGVFW